MPKRSDKPYIELPRSIFINESFLKLSDSQKWLYVVLKECEHRYTGPKEDFFFRSNEDLAKDCGWTVKKLERVKSQLLENKDLLFTWQMHWIDKNTGKKSEKHVTAYRLKI